MTNGGSRSIYLNYFNKKEIILNGQLIVVRCRLLPSIMAIKRLQTHKSIRNEAFKCSHLDREVKKAAC